MKGIQIIGALAALQAVAATGGGKWFGNFKGSNKYEPSEYSKQYCSEKEVKSYDFEDVPEGPINEYDNYKFTGYSCKKSRKFNKRTGSKSSKCASSYVDPDVYDNEIEHKNDKFTIDEIDVSLDYDDDDDEKVLEFQYTMPNGSKCKQVSKCGKGVKSIKNTQCGGAKKVSCRIHKSTKTKPKKKKSCKYNVHHIKFKCDKNKPPTPPVNPPPCYGNNCPPVPCYGENCSSTNPPVPTTTTPPPCYGENCPPPPCYGENCGSSTTTTTNPPPCYGENCNTTTEPAPTTTNPPPCYGENCPPPPCYGENCNTTTEPAPTTTNPPPCYGEDCNTTTEPVPTTTEVPPCYGEGCNTTTEPAPTTTEVPPCYGEDCNTTTEPVPTTTEVPPCYGDNCPPPPCYGEDCGSSTTDTPYVPPTYANTTIVPTETQPPYEPPTYETTTSAYETVPPVPVETGCPPVLPQCMETWTRITKCINSGDVNCLCPDKEYIQNVAGCVEAYGVDDDEVAKALEYLQGLCAEKIPENPAIVTCVPPYITLPAPTAPATTITVVTTVVVPCTTASPEETAKPDYTPSYTTEVVSTTVTVCPVKLVTTKPNEPVLVPGTVTAPPYVPQPITTPAEVPVYSTTGYLPTTMATVRPTDSANATSTPVPPISNDAGAIKVSGLLVAGAMGIIALIMA